MDDLGGDPPSDLSLSEFYDEACVVTQLRLCMDGMCLAHCIGDFQMIDFYR